jgi:predicted FMN-binding regulatory protein PaiB
MKGMRKLGMNWNYDHVKLVGAEQAELEKVVRAMRRWEVRNMEELLEPPSPDEWNDEDIPDWFTQQTAKEIEEKRLAMGESTRKPWMGQSRSIVDPRKLLRQVRVSIRDQMLGKVQPIMPGKRMEKRNSF